VRAGIAEFGVHRVIASSEAVRDFFRGIYAIPDLPLLPCAVDPGRFRPAARKKRQIAFMPRKLKADAAFISQVDQRGAWVKFLSLSHKESFGLPPLEAMACGCIVAGFHGDGGREYMIPKNADMGDYKGCAEAPAAVEVLTTPGPGSILPRGEGG
jgi:glycosyl transferase family 1